jgi:hypothetical protein
MTGSITVSLTRNGVSAGTFNADALRADVDNANPGLGIYHGYSITGLQTGTATWCVTAVNVGSGSNASLGCKSLTII